MTAFLLKIVRFQSCLRFICIFDIVYIMLFLIGFFFFYNLIVGDKIFKALTFLLETLEYAS